jgi:uncharacterized cupredoxin-like copper-binding protein
MRKLLITAFAFMAFSAASFAEEVEATFLVAKLASGATEAQQLTNDSTQVGPMVYNKEGLLVINGNVYQTSEVVSMRIEKRMIDGIEQIENGELRIENEAVYDLSGRQVSTLSSPLSTLPKGIYIVRGKKFIVR